jgi:hypothetical protein
MSGKLTPEEEAWGAARSFYRPAYINFVAGLQQATKGYEPGKFKSECAAVAVAATIAYVKALRAGDHLLAPLEEALEIIEARIDPVSLPYCRRAQAVVSNLDAHKGGSLPSVDEFVNEKRLSKATSAKILGSVAVECQLLKKVSLDQALRIVAGPDSRAHKRLKDFRYNMKAKDSPKGARKEFFMLMQQVAQETAGESPELVAQVTLEIYRNSLGKKS